MSNNYKTPALHWITEDIWNLIDNDESLMNNETEELIYENYDAIDSCLEDVLSDFFDDNIDEIITFIGDKLEDYYNSKEVKDRIRTIIKDQVANNSNINIL